MPPGSVAHLKVLRDGRERDVTVTLSELPEKAAEPAPGASPSENSPMRGVQVQELTSDITQQLGLRPGTKGVVVSEVKPGSPGANAGLRRGDVIQEINRQPVNSVADYQRAIRQPGKQPVPLLVNRQGNSAYVVVNPD
jgi:serine protease Do